MSNTLKDKISEKSIAQAQQYLFESEAIENLFRASTLGSGDDFVCITNKRVIVVDKSVLTTKRTVYSVPINKILFVGLQSGGMMNMTKEIEFAVSGKTFQAKFYSETEALDFHKELSKRISQ